MQRGAMLNVLKYLVAVSLCCLMLSFFFKDRLPDVSEIQPDLLQNPEQTPSESSPFTLPYDDKIYTIYPLYDYELHGMIVSQHDSRSWLDWAHQDWDEYLNVKDICVLWGNNFKGNLHQRLHYDSGDFTCFIKGNNEDWQLFDKTSISNNHLLSSNPELSNSIESANIGDQFVLRGKLVQYKNNKGFSRSTSTSRDDIGDGACETIYVEQFKFLERANPFWHKLFAFSGTTTAIFFLLWLLLSLWSLFMPKSLDPAYYLAQGDSMAAKGKFRNAIKHYDKALQLDPFLSSGYRERGLCWEALGQFEKAASDYHTADRLELEQQPETFL